MRSAPLKVIASTASLLFLCGCAAIQYDMATSKYQDQRHSSPPDVSQYAVNVGTDPLTGFLYLAMKDHPNGFANVSARPMTEEEKILDEEEWEKQQEETLESAAKTNPNLDRAALLRVLPQNPKDKQVLKDPPPGCTKAVRYTVETVNDGARFLDIKTSPHRFTMHQMLLSYDGGVSAEEAKTQARQIFNSVRNLLGNDPKWTYKDDVWLNGLQQAIRTTAIGKSLASQEQSQKTDTFCWAITYLWNSQVVKGIPDHLNYIVGVKKAPNSSRYLIYVALDTVVNKQWDK